ncbi:hypothetical protein Tco_0269867 [Tanacetum coccineum]
MSVKECVEMEKQGGSFTIESKSKEQGADIFSMIQANSLLCISNRWSKKSAILNWKSWVNRPRGIYDDSVNLTT